MCKSPEELWFLFCFILIWEMKEASLTESVTEGFPGGAEPASCGGGGASGSGRMWPVVGRSLGKEVRWEGRRAGECVPPTHDCASHMARRRPLSPRAPPCSPPPPVWIAQGLSPVGRHLCPSILGREQAPHLWWHAADPLEVRQCALSGEGGVTSLSAAISPCRGSRHQLPAETGRFSPARCSWRWRGADGPAWPRFQPDCQGGVGGVTGLVPGAGIQERRAGATSLPSQWDLACMGGGGDHLTVVLEAADAWSCLERDASVFYSRVGSF